jgi:hypothetical protein
MLLSMLKHHKSYFFVWNLSERWERQENLNIKQTFHDITLYLHKLSCLLKSFILRDN